MMLLKEVNMLITNHLTTEKPTNLSELRPTLFMGI
jgi:hypothetical protein